MEKDSAETGVFSPCHHHSMFSKFKKEDISGRVCITAVSGKERVRNEKPIRACPVLDSCFENNVKHLYIFIKKSSLPSPPLL